MNHQDGQKEQLGALRAQLEASLDDLEPVAMAIGALERGEPWPRAASRPVILAELMEDVHTVVEVFASRASEIGAPWDDSTHAPLGLRARELVARIDRLWKEHEN